MGKFETDLDVEQSSSMDELASGRGEWKLVAPLIYKANNNFSYEVPIGFITDFSSVPRVPVVFDVLGDRANESACLHDYFYSKECKYDVTRLHADQLLKEMIESQGIASWIAWAYYIGVRTGGQSHWKT